MKKVRMVYICSHDGNICDMTKPKFDEEGYLIPESSKNLLESGAITEDDRFELGWDICEKCPRNYSLGHPYGKLKCETCNIEKV